MKKVLSLLLVIVMLCSTFAGLQITSSATVPSGGSCGTNVIYTYTNTNGIGVLTISGSGAMSNYSHKSDSPFYNQTEIKYVIIKSGVTSIGDNAFYDCSGLISVTIPDSVTSIGGGAFYGCSGLTSITIPNSVTSIGWHAFSGCSGLTSIDIPNSVTRISGYAFRGCSGLTSITIPDSVSIIGDYAFESCTGLTSVNIPDSVTNIGESAFYECGKLKKVNISSIESWCRIYFCGFESNPLYYSHMLYLKDELVTDLVIPNSVTKIGNYAFYDCTGLTSVTVPNSVTSIGGSAFFGCSSLTSVTVPNSVTNIGDYAFNSCTGLISVYLYSRAIGSTQNLVASMPTNSTLYAYDSTDARIYCSIYGVNFVPLEEFRCDEGVHTYDETITKEATCEESGMKTLTCRFCGYTLTKTIPASRHSWSGWQIMSVPTCEKTGLSMRMCNNCNQVDKLVIPALEHTFVTQTTEPTCTHAGYTTYTCSDCGYSYIGDIVPMAEHNYIDSVTEPTTESQGYTVHTCKDCGYSYVDSITDILPSQMHYIIPSLADIQATVTIKSDENEYSVTAANGVFELDSIKGDVYRVYAKQKNSLTICVGEYDTKSGEITNDDAITFPLGDVNGDDVIDIADVSILLAAGNYGQENAEMDLTGDNMITITDVATALKTENYGNKSVEIV